MNQKELQAAMEFAELIKDLPEDKVNEMLLVSKGMAIVTRDQQKSA